MKQRTQLKPKRRLEYLNDPEDGSPLVLVPLAGSHPEQRTAIVNRADFDRVIAAGLSPNWTFNSGHVRVALNGSSGNLISVARVLTGAGPKERVYHKNDDRSDLRRNNLIVRKGGKARRSDLALVRKRAGVSALMARPKNNHRAHDTQPIL